MAKLIHVEEWQSPPNSTDNQTPTSPDLQDAKKKKKKKGKKKKSRPSAY